MSQRQKKPKPPTNNINININLKLDSKGSQLMGKKIANSKDIQQKHNQLIRSTVVSESNQRKKNQPHKHKRSIQEFIDQNTVNYQEDNQNVVWNFQRGGAMGRENMGKKQKRMKSKSLENLKYRLHDKSPERQSKSHSKSKSKSKSKKKNKNQSPRSNIKSNKSKSHQKSKSHSKSKDKSRSKSPLILNKKRSLQVFKIREDTTTRDRENKDKSRDKKSKELIKDKVQTIRKIGPSQTCRIGSKTINVTKKGAEQHIKDNKPKKSKQKIIPIKPITSTGSKTLKKKQSISGAKPSAKSKKYSKKQQFIYHQSFLNKMATKIQSCWRGYKTRKQLKQQMTQVVNKVNQLKKQINLKNSNFWQTESNHSIIQIDSQSNLSNKSNTQRNTQRSKANPNIIQNSQSSGVNPQFMEELQKLRKKLQQQEDRFRVLAQENNQLRVNLSKIKEPEVKKQKHHSQSLQMNHGVLSMRIDSEQGEKQEKRECKEERRGMKKRDIILELPVQIKTEESFDHQFADLKKKSQSYECSPKSSDALKFKFDKNVIKKLFLKQQQKLNERYFHKNSEYKDLLQSSLVSPKTFNIKCGELQLKYKQQKQQTLKKYKQAQKALMLVAELQQSNNYENEQSKKQNSVQNLRNRIQNVIEGGKSSPIKRANLCINVDEMDGHFQRSESGVVSNSHREGENNQDISELYNMAMSDKVEKKRNIYIENQDQLQEKEGQKQVNYQQFQLNNHSKVESVGHKANGFETNLKYIRLFYIKFCEFFRQNSQFKSQIIQNISSQITFQVDLFLKSFQIRQHRDQLIFPYFKLLASYNSALPVHVLNAYYGQLTNPQSQLFQQNCYDLKQSIPQQLQSYGYSNYELKQYHDLALIDALNEAINYERPGGVEGSNLDILIGNFHNVSRSKVSRKFRMDLEEKVRQQNLDVILGNSIGRVINNWACNLCGFINDNDDEEEKIDQSKLQSLRQHRLSLMLENTLMEQEVSVLDMASFRLVLKLEQAVEIENILIEEVMVQIMKIGMKRQFTL